MKLVKIFVVLALIISLCIPVSGEKRKAQKPMKEFTDPSSPSYVPYPYAKKREKIIANLKYFINRPSAGSKKAFVDGVTPEIDLILENLCEKQPNYEIGEIIKVKNCIAALPDDYSWLILIMDKEEKIAARVGLEESGLFAGAVATTESNILNAPPKNRARLRRVRPLKKKNDVKGILSQSLNREISEQEIKKMEMVVSLGSLCNLTFPLWEIKLANGKTYIYSTKVDMFFEVEKKVHWGKNKKGFREDWQPMLPVPRPEILFDTLNDQLVILKKIDRKM